MASLHSGSLDPDTESSLTPFSHPRPVRGTSYGLCLPTASVRGPEHPAPRPTAAAPGPGGPPASGLRGRTRSVLSTTEPSRDSRVPAGHRLRIKAKVAGMDICGAPAASRVVRRPGPVRPPPAAPPDTPGPSREGLPGTALSGLPAFRFFVERTCQAQPPSHCSPAAHAAPSTSGGG